MKRKSYARKCEICRQKQKYIYEHEHKKNNLGLGLYTTEILLLLRSYLSSFIVIFLYQTKVLRIWNLVAISE